MAQRSRRKKKRSPLTRRKANGGTRRSLKLPLRVRRQKQNASKRRKNADGLGLFTTPLVGVSGFLTPALLGSLVRYYFQDHTDPTTSAETLEPATWTQLGLEVGFAWLTNYGLARVDADKDARAVFNVGQIVRIGTTALSLLVGGALSPAVGRFTGLALKNKGV